jgi:CubicO group peptidase (beta-lactamase class C family)
MTNLSSRLDAVAAENGFSGVIAVLGPGDEATVRAYGFANRAFRVPNTPATRFATASGAKGFTALAVMSLVEDGTLALSTTARSLLRDDLPLVDYTVTIEQLLAHESGIGDYLDEEGDWDPADYVLDVPVHRLVDAEDYVPAIDGFPQKFAPGQRFGYCNGGYVLLAILAERASGVPYHDLVDQRVCAPAGLGHTAFLRSDELPGDAALGYLGDDSDRSNVLHLPVRGVGDGGIYTTAADLRRFWEALFAGRIVTREALATMTAPRHEVPEEGKRYGLGFWLHATGPAVILEGMDSGVSFRSTHDPETGVTVSVLSNTSRGAWPVLKAMAELGI